MLFIATIPAKNIFPHDLAESPHDLAGSPHDLAGSPHDLAESPHDLAAVLKLTKWSGTVY
ncbi:MAG: hypothetical protein HZC28_07550 [Spirochaetes bacterium]|nr:hypothetical protein [Spirochaetota bacterium]